MAITSNLYLSGVVHLNDGSIDWDTDTIKLMLVTSSYTPDQDNHDFRDDLGANEASGTGYTSGGATIGTRSVSKDATSNEVRLIGADVSWTVTSTLAFRYGIIYKSRGGASSADELIGYIDFAAQSVNNTTLTVDFDQTNGIAKYTVA
jgi:hypothetical protein